jgi:hypothetical protein
MMTKTIPRGKYLGQPFDGFPTNEAEHFMRCPACGGLIDCRDLAQALAHNGPLPHPSEDKQQ